jgi:hypothetical protein
MCIGNIKVLSPALIRVLTMRIMPFSMKEEFCDEVIVAGLEKGVPDGHWTVVLQMILIHRTDYSFGE